MKLRNFLKKDWNSIYRSTSYLWLTLPLFGKHTIEYCAYWSCMHLCGPTYQDFKISRFAQPTPGKGNDYWTLTSPNLTICLEFVHWWQVDLCFAVFSFMPCCILIPGYFLVYRPLHWINKQGSQPVFSQIFVCLFTQPRPPSLLLFTTALPLRTSIDEHCSHARGCVI